MMSQAVPSNLNFEVTEQLLNPDTKERINEAVHCTKSSVLQSLEAMRRQISVAVNALR